ncbi:hypothetical protein Ancab_039275 [Ancistrocladus abbreviatus]
MWNKKLPRRLGVGPATGSDLSKRRQPLSGRSAKSRSLKSPTCRATAKQKVYGALTTIPAANGRSVAFLESAATGLSVDRRGRRKPSKVEIEEVGGTGSE